MDKTCGGQVCPRGHAGGAGPKGDLARMPGRPVCGACSCGGGAVRVPVFHVVRGRRGTGVHPVRLRRPFGASARASPASPADAFRVRRGRHVAVQLLPRRWRGMDVRRRFSAWPGDGRGMLLRAGGFRLRDGGVPCGDALRVRRHRAFPCGGRSAEGGRRGRCGTHARCGGRRMPERSHPAPDASAAATARRWPVAGPAAGIHAHGKAYEVVAALLAEAIAARLLPLALPAPTRRPSCRHARSWTPILPAHPRIPSLPMRFF